MPTFKTLWIAVLFCSDAQGAYLPSSNKPVALGVGNIAAFKSNPFAANNHPGTLAFANKNSLSLGVESLFLVEGLNMACLSWNYRLNKRQILGLGYNFFGHSAYNESMAKIAIAQKLSPVFGAGLSLDYFRLQLPSENFGVKHLLSIEAGIYASLSSNIDFALHVLNPFRPRIGEYMDERLPFVVNATILYKPNKNAIIASEWHQIMNEKGQLRAGVIYKVSEKMSLRGGAYFKPINLGFGFTYCARNLSVHFDFAMHPYLNLSSAAAITYTSTNESQDF